MKFKALWYCTKGKPELWSYESYYGSEPIVAYGVNINKKHIEQIGLDKLNGKIVAESEIECEEILFLPNTEQVNKHNCYKCSIEDEHKCGYNKEIYSDYYLEGSDDNCVVYYSCMKSSELHSRLKGKNGYALHITNLKIFDRPLELNECKKYHTQKDIEKVDCFKKEVGLCNLGYSLKEPNKWIGCNKFTLTKAPSNMQRVWYNGELYILISNRPEGVCNILNGKKTVEVSNKILKGMI